MKKAYLMTSGALLPAFAATAVYMAIQKQAKLNMTNLIIFAVFATAGGYYTSQLLKD